MMDNGVNGHQINCVQSHLFNYDGLTQEEQCNLALELESLDLVEVTDAFKACTTCPPINFQASEVHAILDNDHFGSQEDCLSLTTFWDSGNLNVSNATDIFTGIRAIAEGNVGAILLAGGQGTRLGVKYPKGMYDVGLPSQKTLFQLQAERILKLQALATDSYPSLPCKIIWYIMTSEATGDATRQFFERYNYFGLHCDQVFFFAQGWLPCFSLDGDIFKATASTLSKAPDGNGGLYRALKVSGALEHMQKHQLQYFHIYCVDNILVKVADPTFIGFCIEKNADCGNKVVEKTDPNEPVGVTCSVDGIGPRVLEYTELPDELKNLKNGQHLLFNAGNVANHFFRIDFLERVVNEDEKTLVHHIAKKKIPYYDNVSQKIVIPEKPNGVKLEKFVFDVFPFSKNFVVWEVPRDQEFSPLKNSDAANVACPKTSRANLLNLHAEWCTQAGAVFMGYTEGSGDDLVNHIVEISPNVSYGGEGLADFLKGKEIYCPIYFDSIDKMKKLPPSARI